ncbi:ThiF family adenylyltransferase [Sanguibacter suaedae]|uniref:ThiF family adenylyltransferase n=1 Tax=Sanguibacter suaedae TaxID=2795737 RepID=A0A934MC73_9MICO|nr:ThiF family adenylyltransferase [Sanguibacter suaedae]MBI9116096.1 ThiF family adenylyltransferase [Sanguibacter suaedae]
MELRTGLRILDRAPHAVQVGTDERWSVTVDGLTPQERTALLGLGDGPAGRRPRWASSEDAPHRLQSVLDDLTDAGLLQESPAATGPAGLGSPLDDEVVALQVAGAGTRETVGVRRDRRVGVVGLGRIGMVVVDVLASAGVGTFLLDDPRRVRRADVGVGGLRERHVGAARAHCAADVLGREHPDARVGSGTRETPDVVVIVFEEAADPVRTARLMMEEVPHLPVVVREGDVVVGPFVVPGRSACLTCLDMHRTDMDPGWPALAAQLRAIGSTHPAPQPSVVASVAGGAAAAQVLAFLDGQDPAATGTALEVRGPDARPRVRRWSVHPGCGCTDLLGADVPRA